jgi:hypothetical protein
MTFDYKKYSLEQLDNWMHDALTSAEATPQEIYDVIKGVVEENYYHHKLHTSRCYELLALLNGNGKGHLTCDEDKQSEECKGAWTSFWEENYYPEEHQQYTDEELNAMCDAVEKKDKVKKWVLPVEECKDSDTDETEYFVSFPDDLLEAANLKEGDQIQWIDNGDGSYKMVKVTEPLKMDEC